MVSDVTIESAIASQTATSAASDSLAGDFSDFLNLLTVQLQNQDPLQPMDSTEFTNQLVQFTAVEQQINSNQKLDDLIALQLSNALSSSQSFVGTNVSYVSSEFAFNGSPSEIRYSLPRTSVDTTLRIYNDEGGLVYEEEVSGAAGASEFVWDGRQIGGGIAPDGTYEVEIDAIDETDEPIQATTVVTGRVDGVESQNGQIFLIVGERAVALANVLNTTSPETVSDAGTALTSALDYIGLQVSYDNDRVNLTSADREPEIVYDLSEDVDRVRILVLDDRGIVVDSIDPTDQNGASALQEGAQTITWSPSSDVDNGQYTFTIDALKQRETAVKQEDLTYNSVDTPDEIEYQYTIPTAADKVEFRLLDDNGNIIYTDDAPRAAGVNTYTFDVPDGLSNGQYSIDIVNIDEEDTSIPVSSQIFSTVTGVESDNGVIFLQVEGTTRTIPLSEILQVLPQASGSV